MISPRKMLGIDLADDDRRLPLSIAILRNPSSERRPFQGTDLASSSIARRGDHDPDADGVYEHAVLGRRARQ